MITAEEFERGYAERSGWTVERLRRYRTVRRCDCGGESCEGWASLSPESAADWDADAPLGGRIAGSVIAGLS